MNPILKLRFSELKKQIYLFFYDLLKQILFFVEFFLLLRFLLKFFNANPQAKAVSFLYFWTDYLAIPFEFIFPNFYWKRFYVETTSLMAMIGFLIFFFLLIQVLKIIFREE